MAHRLRVGQSLVVLYILTSVSDVASQVSECPYDWEMFQDSCYRFEFHPVKAFDEAKAACKANAATLVSVDSPDEHNFISTWLLNTDTRRQNWYTSGEQDVLKADRFWWSGSGLQVNPSSSHWVSLKVNHGRALIYRFDGVKYGWSRARSVVELPYICEIARVEAHRIFQQRRTFLFGSNYEDLSLVERGPAFIIQPHDLIIIGNPPVEYIECSAVGNPQPVYRWRKMIGSRFEDVSEANPRYTFTNGRFSFVNPTEEGEAGVYQCIASNKFGEILSSTVKVSFGFLRQFQNVPRDTVTALGFQGASIECGQPESKPGVKFQWYKDSPLNFVRPTMQTYIFISQNGKLYFSEVANPDQGSYRCIVTLQDLSDRTRVTNQQLPSGTSLPIPLFVTGSPPLEWGPQIQNDFIAIFPKSPLRGDTVRMECFAYGTAPLVYSWSRIDKQMPRNVQFEDHYRVLVISNAQLEDSGQYNCHVSRSSAFDDKLVDLTIAAIPYFITPLGDAHVDENTQFTWRCEAKGSPPPTYTWYKNGQVLKSIPGEVEINRNVAVFYKLNAKLHNGMYQCKATNLYGSSYSSGQLRALVFKPSFTRRPTKPHTTASINGNVTLECRPEASPFPTIEWSKNGGNLGLTVGVDSNRYLLDVSGDLIIHDIQPSDVGTYTCTATNDLGTDSSSTFLEVLRGTTIFRSPGPTEVIVNSTAFFFCQASHANHLDLVYQWYFNDHRIDVINDPYFIEGSGANTGGLYVRNAQLLHNGLFKCVAQTPLDRQYAEAKLTVIGPPSEMAGVYVDPLSVTPYSMRVKWTTTGDNGRPILSFIIEALTLYHEDWFIVANDIDVAETYLENEDKSTFVVDGLKPNVGYQFRILAVNEVGIGAPSEASEVYNTPGAPPNVAPERVGGGGGSVGLLTITWDPLAPIDAHGSEIGYNIFWRKQGDTFTWSKSRVKGNEGKYSVLVGEQNFYLPYEVKIQATNEYGMGPNSSVEVVYSAEGLPVVVMTGLFDLDVENGTAITLSWDPLPELRETIKGKVAGYWINYWLDPELNEMDEDTEVFYNYKPVYGQVGETTVVGLQPGTYYLFTMQVFNTAGLGPVSEDEFEETDGLAPLRYPMHVEILSHGVNSVFVSFRGLTMISQDEDPVRGYMIRYWLAGNSIEEAIDIDLEMETKGVITGLEKNKLYEMRTLAYNDGGYGKHSPTIYFTLGGQVVLDSTLTELVASGHTHAARFLIIMSSFIVFLLNSIM